MCTPELPSQPAPVPAGTGRLASQVQAQPELHKTSQRPRRGNARASNWALRRRAAANLLRMGHCAPTVMQTLLDVSNTHQEWLVKLSAGMPGGIGNTGFECGAMTSPLVLLGLRHGLREMDRGLPRIFDEGHAHCQRFLACHKTLLCRQIRRKDGFPRHCIAPVCMSPELSRETLAHRQGYTIPAESRAAYSLLYSHMTHRRLHCAGAVLDNLPLAVPDRQNLRDAVSAFTGGTLFLGLTCSVYTAGVMAIGLARGEIENNALRVAQMLWRMTFGGNAFDEKINKFNRSMNAAHRLSKWFAEEFGGTQCRAITQCDFSTLAGVHAYIEGDRARACVEMAGKVASKVRAIIEAPVISARAPV